MLAASPLVVDPRGERVQGGLGQQQRGGTQQVRHADVLGSEHGDAREVAEGQGGVALLGAEHHERRALGTAQSSSRSSAWLVFGLAKAPGSKIAMLALEACNESALRSAARCSLRFTLKV